ncbi:MAG: AsmA family protein [Acidobacteriaceae bacterium]|nr:AsmA family protein [Acidobacteriaceae bacterium]
MQQTDPTYASAASQPPKRRSHFRRFVLVYYVLLALMLIAFIPSYISINRYQHRIAESIGRSLGRPVHLDKVTLNLLPLPGFTIENLVVSEDPAFGSEPVIRANSVHATLRVWPLWRRKVEFATISFTEPSVNLVHLPNGKWNLESILIQAAHIQTAPTAQKTSGPAPRFPYIEATGARVNLKQGQEKMPFSLNDAEFALWLPNPQEWHLRLEAHPARSDTFVSDTGILRVEGTLRRASSLAEVPINLDAQWINAPLGEFTHLLLGRDAGVRGDMNLIAHTKGTVGDSTLIARLRLDKLRRAEFIPESSVAVDLQCQSSATNSFHSFPDATCAWTPSGGTQPITLKAAVPDVRELSAATATLTTENLPVAATMDWLRILSRRLPADLSAQGTLNATIAPAPLIHLNTQWDTKLNASLEAGDLTLISPQSGLTTPLAIGEIDLHSLPPTAPAIARNHRPAPPTPSGIVLAPTTLALGGKEPATLEARIDAGGYTLHLSGMVVLARLSALGKALPFFGDGLADALPADRAAGPVRIDMNSNRPWGGVQSWQDSTSHPIPNRRIRR